MAMERIKMATNQATVTAGVSATVTAGVSATEMAGATVIGGFLT